MEVLCPHEVHIPGRQFTPPGRGGNLDRAPPRLRRIRLSPNGCGFPIVRRHLRQPITQGSAPRAEALGTTTGAYPSCEQVADRPSSSAGPSKEEHQLSSLHCDRTVVLDCRWLGFTGAGRVVELLLQGCRERPPNHRWVLWGPPEIESYAWPGAGLAVVESRPTAWRGQRDFLRVPPGDLVVFMHQQRPLRRTRALTMILDTTPVQYPGTWLEGKAKLLFLKRAAALSCGVLTISDFSRRCIIDELGVDPDDVSIVHLPADRQLAERVLALRARSSRQLVALYLGLFLPHKNLPRLIEAFGQTAFRRQGGRLVLVGGRQDAQQLADSLDVDQRSYIEVRPRCTQAEVEDLLATSLFLVQPSLVEGFGLPVFEALSSGLPACVSDGGALPEISGGLVDHFPATSVPAMVDALDRTAEAAGSTHDGGRSLSARLLASAPTIAEFATEFQAVVGRYLGEHCR